MGSVLVKVGQSAVAVETCGRPYSGHAMLLHGFKFSAPNMDSWTRDHEEMRVGWGDPSVGSQVAGRLRTIMLQDRWSRIAQQECAAGAEDGLDWSVARRMLKGAAKRPLVLAGLRLLWQRAVRRANHGGDVLCQMCGKPNSWRHALHDCRRWAAFDLGPDPSWEVDVPKGPDCFVFRGLVPKQLTMHPPLSEIQMKRRANGIFAGESLPASSVYYGTDASGGLRGADPRLRVVSWAVVAICECVV